jgi:hypothetical protein
MFVDFDNVYSGLQRLDSDAAKSFAEDPAGWVESLTAGADEDGPYTRRFLVRKCYLNPASFSRYRPYFTRAGFQVVDCPSLTQQGKSSADINLVLDAVDALSASTHFDEFVFLSADADFTPLITRCRAADRQVTIITSGPASAAYRAVADAVIAPDSFIELLTVTESAAAVYIETENLAAVVPEHSEPVSTTESASLAADLAVRQLVGASARPVVLANAASVALRADASIRESDWAGTGSFTGWLNRALPDLPFDTRAPGYVWDPSRFSEADLPGSPVAQVRTPGLSELQRQVVAITEIPALSQNAYRILIDQLSFDLALYPFSRTDTSKRVRDECAKADTPIGRAAINFVINGLLLAGANLDESEPTAIELATLWAENVAGLCEGARVELDNAELVDIATWVSGGHVGETE